MPNSGHLRSRLAVVLLIAVSDAIAAEPLKLPERKPLALRPVAKLNAAINEGSGLVRSRSREDLFWMLNDSGNEPRIFPIHRNGLDYRGTEPQPGVLIAGATNVDWEDLTTDDDGQLIIADVGNNANNRENLALYFIAEPLPQAGRAPVVKRVPVRYPDQTVFPAPKNDFNFDCEAVFTVGKTVHLLTKHRSDAWTKLYRLDDPQPQQTNVLTLVDRFNAGGMVTGANASRDGKRLVMLTYLSVWLFERDDLATPFFQGRVFWAPIASVQMEAVCFADDDTLLLGDEKLGQLYEVPIAELSRVR